LFPIEKEKGAFHKNPMGFVGPAIEINGTISIMEDPTRVQEPIQLLLDTILYWEVTMPTSGLDVCIKSPRNSSGSFLSQIGYN